MNHCMLGHIQEWFQSNVGGIKPSDEEPGFKTFVIRPEPVTGLESASAIHKSPYGMISSSWKRTGDNLTLDLTVPVNTTALVSMPATAADAVKEAGRSVEGSRGVQPVGFEDGRAQFRVGSGRYSFEAWMN